MSIQYGLIFHIGRSLTDIKRFCYHFESKTQPPHETCELSYRACRPYLTKKPGSETVKVSS